MLNSIIFKYLELQDTFFTKQLYSFSFWLEKNSSQERQVYYIETKKISRKVSLCNNYKSKEPSFVFCERGCFEVFLKKENTNNHGIKNKWIKIFSHYDYEIYENIATLERGSLPLRFGLSQEEQNILLSLARNTFTSKMELVQESMTVMPDRLMEVCDVDVTLWSEGKFHGSQIVFGLPLKNGVIEATKRALNDTRFQIIKEGSHADIRIEVVLLHSLKMPLLYSEIKRDIPIHDKAYCANIKGLEGWYLPAVFNCVDIRSLNHLIVNLFREKLSMQFSSRFFKNISVSQVYSFIESYDHTKSLPLDGPVLASCQLRNISPINKYLVDNFLEYLERTQDENGLLLSVVNPSTGHATNEDFVRLCFVVFSLFFYLEKRSDTRGSKIAHKSYEYIKNEIEGKRFYLESHKVISYIYYARASQLCDDMESFKKSLLIVESLIVSCPYEPILYSQYALLLLGKADSYTEKIENIVIIILRDFQNKEKNKQDFNLASYAELPRLCLLISKFSKERDFYVHESKRITSLYVSLQNDNGSFPTSSSLVFSYTRGTSKILEVLTQLGGVPEDVIEKTFDFILRMQYDEENSYCIPETYKEFCEGGIRHDYFNKEIWSDAIGHMLIALALASKK